MARRKRQTVIAVGFGNESFARASSIGRFGKNIDFQFIRLRKKRRR